MADVNSVNPVFVNFGTLDPNVTVTFKADSESAAVEQKGAELLEKLGEPNGARFGYGVGYAGLPYVNNVIMDSGWDGPNIPFHSELAGVPWGRAVLCTGKKTAASGDDLAKIELEAIDPQHIHGTCYGTTIKDSSVQMNCGFSVAAGADPVESSDKNGLYIAVMARAEQNEDESWTIGKGETVVAISEAIDPTVFSVGTGNTLKFNIPEATGGYTFTARGTLAKAPFVRRVTNYTSMNDKVSSYPTSQAILDAKVNAG